MSNTINWGKIHGLSYSPETNLTGTATTPSFTNTKSTRFDGVDDFVDCGDNDNLSFGNGSTDSPFSISAWIKMDSAVRFRICSKDNTSKREYLLSTSGGNQLLLNLFSQNGTNRIGRMTGSISSAVGAWTHVCATYDGSGAASGIKLYVNATQSDISDNNSGSYVAMQNNTASFKIGTDLSHYADGSIDEVSVFNSELSASDVTAIYGSGVPTSLSSYSSLVSWWRCGDGDSAPTLLDNGSASNNGTMTNFTTFSTDVPT